MQYGTATIQQFLSTKFSNEQLTSVSYEYFPEVYLALETGASKQEKVQRLLAYCQQQDRITSLLAMMERERPYDYKEQYSSVSGRTKTRTAPLARRNPRQLFISHSHEDADLANYFAKDLRRRGWPIWIARESMRPGEKWLEAVSRGLDESGMLLLLLTPDAVSSDWVHSETSLALEQHAIGQLQIIMVEMKPTAEVPPDWGEHRRLPFNRGYRPGVLTLMGLLEALLGPPPKAAAQPKAGKPAAGTTTPKATQRPPAEPPRPQQAVRIDPPFEAAAPKQGEVRESEAEGSPPGGRAPEPAAREPVESEPPPAEELVVSAEGTKAVAKEPPAAARKEARETAADKGGNMLWEKDGKEMVRIPAGTFLYGKAKQEVSLPDYWIDRTPVTNAEYARFIAASGRKPPKHWGGEAPPDAIAHHPVVFVSWDDACAYAAWFGKRLPEEQEWEKAARGDDGRTYPWGEEEATAEHCNFNHNVGSTTPVKRYSPRGDSRYGCTDMAGNVWEWTDSTTVEVMKVFRGGAFNCGMGEVRAAHRDGFLQDERRSDLGFRTVVRLSE